MLKSDDDAGREGVNPYEESGYYIETDPLIKSGRSNASNFGQNDYQVSAETFQRRSNDSSSGSSGRYSSKSSTALRNKADSRQSSIPKKSTIPSDYRSSGVESSQSFVIEDNVPFSSAREKDDSIMGQDFIDWNEIPDENAVDKAGLAFSRQETPMVFRYGKDPMDTYQTTSPLETGTRETSPAGLQDVGSFRTHEYSLTKETSEDVSTSRPVARRSSSGDTYILPGKSGK